MGVTFTYNEPNPNKPETGRLGALSEPSPRPYKSGFNVIALKIDSLSFRRRPESSHTNPPGFQIKFGMTG